jgi:hypothetical protein
MGERKYYSARTGKNPEGERLSLDLLKRLFATVYEDFERRCYFQEAFGYSCVDAGYVVGKLGSDIEAYMIRKLRKTGLWPIALNCGNYREEDLFDVIEFLVDCVSKPTLGFYHEWDGCGWHYSEFDKKSGQEEFRSELNQLLSVYGSGYELSAEGEILNPPETGMASLLEAQLPKCDPENIKARVDNAVLKFRRYRSSLEERREAVRELADVLEFLRPKLKDVITSNDESDLFNIANNFGIRHHNQKQKIDYDQSIWLPWMFYYYLATIHSVLRLIEKKEKGSS